MKEFLNDFKAFAFKGNMMDLAIGMIIGAAFTALVNSVVSNLFMPIISLFTGGIDFSNLYLPLSAGSKEAFMAVQILLQHVQQALYCHTVYSLPTRSNS